MRFQDINKIRKLKEMILFYAGQTRPNLECIVVVIVLNVPRQAFSNWRVSRKANKNDKETTNCHEDLKNCV